MKKKLRKIRIIFDVENWLWKSEIGNFRSLDLDRVLIYQKIFLMKKCYFSLNLMCKLLKKSYMLSIEYIFNGFNLPKSTWNKCHWSYTIAVIVKISYNLLVSMQNYLEEIHFLICTLLQLFLLFKIRHYDRSHFVNKVTEQSYQKCFFSTCTIFHHLLQFGISCNFSLKDQFCI